VSENDRVCYLSHHEATDFPKIYLLEILRILLRDESLAADVNIEMLAAKTDSFSGSDLKRKMSQSRYRFFLS
jgi:ATP-dependent 26S proteasome regulatory subunit